MCFPREVLFFHWCLWGLPQHSAPCSFGSWNKCSGGIHLVLAMISGSRMVKYLGCPLGAKGASQPWGPLWAQMCSSVLAPPGSPALLPFAGQFGLQNTGWVSPLCTLCKSTLISVGTSRCCCDINNNCLWALIQRGQLKLSEIKRRNL